MGEGGGRATNGILIGNAPCVHQLQKTPPRTAKEANREGEMGTNGGQPTPLMTLERDENSLHNQSWTEAGRVGPVLHVGLHEEIAS